MARNLGRLLDSHRCGSLRFWASQRATSAATKSTDPHLPGQTSVCASSHLIRPSFSFLVHHPCTSTNASAKVHAVDLLDTIGVEGTFFHDARGRKHGMERAKPESGEGTVPPIQFSTSLDLVIEKQTCCFDKVDGDTGDARLALACRRIRVTRDCIRQTPCYPSVHGFSASITVRKTLISIEFGLPSLSDQTNAGSQSTDTVLS